METKISALIDGELDARETREVCAALRHDKALRRVSGIYALIGDALRAEPYLAIEVSAAVMTQLAGEPVVLAPGALTLPQPQPQSWRRPALALAATLAGVAVVVWLGLPVQRSGREPLALNGIAQTGDKHVPQQLVMATATDADMQEFLIAHQLHSGSYLNGESQRIRTVSTSGAESPQ